MGNTKDLAHRMEREIEEIHKRKAGAFDKLLRLANADHTSSSSVRIKYYYRANSSWHNYITTLEEIEAIDEKLGGRIKDLAFDEREEE